MIQNPIVNHHIYQRNGQLHCKARPRSDLAKESAYCKVPPTITMYVPSVALFYGKWYRFLRFLLFLNEQVEKYGKMTSMIKIDLEPQSSAQMEPIHSVRAGIFFCWVCYITPTICASFQILDDWDAQSAKIGRFDELWWIMMNYMAGIRPKASSDGNSPALIPAAPLTLTHLFQPQGEFSIFLKQKVIWLKQS